MEGDWQVDGKEDPEYSPCLSICFTSRLHLLHPSGARWPALPWLASPSTQLQPGLHSHQVALALGSGDTTSRPGLPAPAATDLRVASPPLFSSSAILTPFELTFPVQNALC